MTEIYKSLAENGIQSPFFDEVVRAVLTIIGGGGKSVSAVDGQLGYFIFGLVHASVAVAAKITEDGGGDIKWIRVFTELEEIRSYSTKQATD